MRLKTAGAGAVGLLIVLSLSGSNAFAVALPAPPEQGNSANVQNGPLQSSDQQSFAGGVFLVKEGSSDQNVSASSEVAQFFCAAGDYRVSKTFGSSIGESMDSAISSEQAGGIIQALASLRPPKTVSLSTHVYSLAYGFGNTTYKLTAVTYNVTTYSVWIRTQQAPPVEHRVGYIVMGTPKQMRVVELTDDFGGAGTCPPLSFKEVGPAFRSDSSDWLHQLLAAVTPDGGVASILTYGDVRIQSGGTTEGAATLRTGENASFLLPPGDYSAVSDVKLFGIPLSMSAGTQSSSVGSGVQLTVWLTAAEYLLYGLELLVATVLLIAIWLVGRKVGMWSVLGRASVRGLRYLRPGYARNPSHEPGATSHGAYCNNSVMPTWAPANSSARITRIPRTANFKNERATRDERRETITSRNRNISPPGAEYPDCKVDEDEEESEWR